MIRKVKALALLCATEPGWAVTLAVAITSLSIGLIGAYLSNPWGYLAFIGGTCFGSLISAMFEMSDIVEEINKRSDTEKS